MDKKKNLGLIILIIPFLIFVPILGDFFYQPGSNYSDLTVSHLPNALFIRETLFQGNGIPFWSPTILSGYPFAADPLSGLWYLPGWLTILFPVPFVYNLVFILHLFFGGMGTYFLLKAQGLKVPASILGGLLFEFMPKLFAHYSAGHITFIYAICWTPWLLLAEHHWEMNRNKNRFWASPGIVLGIIGLADIRWALFAGILWWGYALFVPKTALKLDAYDEELRGVSSKPVGSRWKSFLSRFPPCIVQTFVAVLIAAPVLLPLMQYTQLSTRSSLTIAENSTLSLNPVKILDLLFPDIGGYAEWVIYPGTFTILSVLVLLLSSRLRKQLRFWWIAGGIALVYALGSYLPLLPDLAYLPGFNLLRVPSRAIFILDFAMVIMTAHVTNAWMDKEPFNLTGNKTRLTPFLAAISLFTLLLSGGVVLLTGSLPTGFLWGTIGICLASLLVGLRLYMKISYRVFIGCVLVFSFIDLGGVNYLSIEPQSPVSVYSEGEAVAEYISQQSGLFRIYSPSYSIPQLTAAQYGLQLADGVDPLQLTTYSDFMSKATGVPADGYSVTMPPFSTGSPAVDNQGYIPDAKLLGMLNVKYVVSAFDIDTQGLDFVAKLGETRIYHNEYYLPRAWKLPAKFSAADPALQQEIFQNASFSTIYITMSNPNKIELDAQGPGLLVLSEINYPGWSVTVDGVKKPITSFEGLFKAVNLETGEHTVEFFYTPWATYLGLAFFLLACSAIMIFSLLRKKSTRLT